ncbi:MAG: Rdx family protein [Candidatus Marinimicrobia bacterium]|nr:Rdx family protein [Candidatus Neomarinimicrobiota bacterium]
MEEELKANLDAIIVELVKGRGGVFKVTVDGKKIFSKRKILGRFPHKDEITKLIQQLN